MITEKIGLVEHFEDLEDPRSRDCPHDFFEILIILREHKAKKKESIERAYYISSLEPDAQKLLECTKAHWEVENKLHWMLDVIFGEDASRIRTGDAPHNLSAIRKLAHYHLKQETSQKIGVKMKQKKAALSTEYLEKVLATTLSGN